jgi:hypothetical protein
MDRLDEGNEEWKHAEVLVVCHSKHFVTCSWFRGLLDLA